MQSKNPCLVGISGIVIHETENTFKVITPNNQLKRAAKLNRILTLVESKKISCCTVIPKSNSIFSFRIPLYDVRSADEPIKQLIPSLEFQLYGNHFRFRASDRSSRKFKHKETIELWRVVYACTILVLTTRAAQQQEWQLPVIVTTDTFVANSITTRPRSRSLHRTCASYGFD